MSQRFSPGPLDPIVVEPPGFDVRAAWKECSEYVDRMRAAGRDIAAAFGADPGCCSCPACQQTYWAWGSKQRCASCGFVYPTDAWAMYSFGVQAARSTSEYARYKFEQRMKHPYYRYGFEHPPGGDDVWGEFHRIDWKAVFGKDGLHPQPTGQ